MPEGVVLGAVDVRYGNVSEVSFDRDNRRLQIITYGRSVVVDGVDRLYVRSVPWSEADGAIRIKGGRVSISGNIAAVEY